MTPPLAGRAALVTGASRGIGRAIATILANAGARLTLLARDARPLEQFADELHAHAITCDVGNIIDAERMEGRDVVEGTLGCPICHEEYRIVGGVAHFDRGAAGNTPGLLADESEAMRLAALLDLTDARGYAILVGETGVHAP